MAAFNFKRFYVRSINAASGAERQAINAELKALYASLTETEKQRFNAELQAFLVQEYQAIGAEYQALRGGSPAADA